MNEREEKIVKALMSIIKENGFTEFVGTFRTDTGFLTFSLEAPGYQNGDCLKLRDTLIESIVSLGLGISDRNELGYIKEQKQKPKS